MPSAQPSRSIIIATLDEVYRGPAWHGPAVLEALKDVNAAIASAKPDPDRHSIWELVRHLAHGRHLMIERLTETTSHFPRPVREPWWPEAPGDNSEQAWRADLALLDEYHTGLVRAATDASEAALARVPNPGDQPLAQQLLGVAIHDAYHAGQIRLLALRSRAPA